MDLMVRGRLVLAAVAAVALSALSATAAEARYYMNKREAEHFMRDHLRQQGYRVTAAYCRPQGRNRPEPGYDYHRWTCGWAAGHTRLYPDCKGQTIVIGSSEPGTYYTKVVAKHGEDCL